KIADNVYLFKYVINAPAPCTFCLSAGKNTGSYSINSPDSCINIVATPIVPFSSFKAHCVNDKPCLGAISLIASTTLSNGTYLDLKNGLLLSLNGCFTSF